MIILAAVAAVVFIVVAIFGLGSFNTYYGYGGYYGGMMGGFGGLGMLLWIPIVLVIVAFVGYFLLRGNGGYGMGGGCCGGDSYGRYASSGNRGDAAAILRQRYARGEISREQFEQMRKDIDSQ